MTWNKAIDAGCALAGISFAKLARRLDMKSRTTLDRYRAGVNVPSVVRYQQILDALGLSGGYDGATGWWVARPEDVTLPPEG